MQPVEVERVRVGTWSGSDRVKVIDGDVASHRVIGPHRAERVNQTLKEPGGPEPGTARGINRVLARDAVKIGIDALRIGRFHSQPVKPLRAYPVRMLDPSA